MDSKNYLAGNDITNPRIQKPFNDEKRSPVIAQLCTAADRLRRPLIAGR